jgi:hypothetical protein
VILDNNSTHKTVAIKQWLEKHRVSNALHPDQRVLAERRGRLVCTAKKMSVVSGRLHQRRRSEGGYPPIYRGSQHEAERDKKINGSTAQATRRWLYVLLTPTS